MFSYTMVSYVNIPRVIVAKRAGCYRLISCIQICTFSLSLPLSLSFFFFFGGGGGHGLGTTIKRVYSLHVPNVNRLNQAENVASQHPTCPYLYNIIKTSYNYSQRCM